MRTWAYDLYLLAHLDVRPFLYLITEFIPLSSHSPPDRYHPKSLCASASLRFIGAILWLFYIYARLSNL